MYIQRAIEHDILQTSATFPVVLVTGPRQVGKTTTLRHLAETGRTYVSLENPNIRLFAKTEPSLFLQKYPPPVLIDEIQYAPEILPYIKMSVDEHHENGAFWLTGSQMFSMMKNVSESLAGRVGILHFLGLSHAEIAGTATEPFTTEPKRLTERSTKAVRQTMPEIYQAIFRGTFPALVINPNVSRENFYSSYIATYLERDINSLTQVADISTFLKFMKVVAARTGRMLVYDDIAKDAGISATTAKRWMSILVSLYVVALLPPYHSNILKRIVKSPVIHFLDTGLCTYLLGWESPDTLESSIMAGNLLESYVFSEIFKSYLAAGREPPLYFYRDDAKREIDLLIHQNGTLSPIEVKKTGRPGKGDLQHIRYVRERLDRSPEQMATGAVICLADDLIPLDKETWSVPVWII
ncbi:MAG TPA: ATP-binding protein [Methanocorpusculum sp.]|nr:ATP-binding protein [Methanocorpusculum sp.]